MKSSVLALLAILTSCTTGAVTLPELIHKSTLLPEYREPDNKNLQFPEYLSYYQPTMTQWLSSLFGLRPPSALVEITQQLLESVVKLRELNGYAYRHVAKLIARTDDSLFIWSNLQSGFHTFIRGLEDLHRRGIITTDLSLTSKRHHIVLNGNIMGSAPYNLELLAVVLQLLLKNPHQVYYIAGTNEARELWIEQGLLRQIGALIGLEGAKFATAAPYRTFKHIEQLLIRFFNTLPLALYIHHEKEPSALIQISSLPLENSALDTTQYGDFFERISEIPEQRYLTYRVAHRVPSRAPYTLHALITTPGDRRIFAATKGLLHKVAPIRTIGASLPIWELFSGQTKLYRDLHDFIYDAYLCVTLAATIDQSEIALYNRNIYTNAPFSRTYHGKLVQSPKEERNG